MQILPPATLSGIRIEPVIAYRGDVPFWARDMLLANPFYTFWFLDRGKGELKWQGKSKSLTTGAAVVIPPGLRRRHAFSGDARIVSVSFWAGWESGTLLYKLDAPCMLQKAPARSLRRKAVAVTSESILPMGSDGGGGSMQSWLRFHSALEIFVAELLEVLSAQKAGSLCLPQPGDVRLQAVITDLAGQARAGALPFSRWRAMTGLGPVQLNRLALRWLGKSLRKQRDEYLLDEIRRSIARGTESLKETAARLGFFDAPHFHRWVKAQTGMNPGDLRKTWI